MTVGHLPEACFEGVIPSLVATVGPDGLPNIAYLSQVLRLDDRQVGLSNQFFGKTAVNLQANPRAALLVVDGMTGAQFELAAVFDARLDHGPLFDGLKAQLDADFAVFGLNEIMRLRAVDVFTVQGVRPIPGPVLPRAAPRPVPNLAAVAQVAERIASVTEVEQILDATLEGTCGVLGCGAAILFIADAQSESLAALASHGYAQSGVGAEVGPQPGLIRIAAATRCAVRLNDLSRSKRMVGAVRAACAPGDDAIPLPALPEAQSQIAIPLIWHNSLIGVLFAESRQRLAFSAEAVGAAKIIAFQVAAALSAADQPGEAEALAEPQLAAAEHAQPGAPVILTHHSHDDSVFLNGHYVTRGVAGRLLIVMAQELLRSGRTEFTNMELRRMQDLKLPDFKDNLETRLLLLRRRLDEREMPLRLRRVGRGRVRLEATTGIRLASADAGAFRGAETGR
ncbi:adenylate cyclase [Gemmobacter aquatilis]|uniref:Adenylate cyclase n=1 Tax=Gemmobacter aquatilis TaxID=933059 RepID=A0A1H7Z4T2_9RHOB|nr:GAF domain-containing protein [Gemmobacter aquatilis]SEM52558.1 adenylate cyclase [Gemmobacter aquatilis]